MERQESGRLRDCYQPALTILSIYDYSTAVYGEIRLSSKVSGTFADCSLRAEFTSSPNPAEMCPFVRYPRDRVLSPPLE
jgi:hypothetical protein